MSRHVLAWESQHLARHRALFWGFADPRTGNRRSDRIRQRRTLTLLPFEDSLNAVQSVPAIYKGAEHCPDACNDVRVSALGQRLHIGSVLGYP